MLRSLSASSPRTSHPEPRTFHPPPWHLTGSAILLIHGWRSLLALVHYASSPVGPYDELAVSTLTMRGPMVIEMYVNSEASMIGGREGWGFPKQMAQLHWKRRGRRMIFQAGSRRWRVRLLDIGFPVRARLWSVQILDEQPVKVPLHIAGHVRLAFQGRRLALVVEPFEMTVLPPLPIS